MKVINKMRKLMFLFVMIIICCSSIVAQEIPEKLLYVVPNNSSGSYSLRLLNLKNNSESKLFNVDDPNFDVFLGKIVYIVRSKNTSIIKVYDMDKKSSQTIINFNTLCEEPIWDDSSNIFITLKDSQVKNDYGIAKFKLDINTGEETDMSIYDMMYKCQYKKSKLYMAKSPDRFDSMKVLVYKGEKLIYKHDCEYPSFINDQAISFGYYGNIYVYNLISKKLIKFTDFQEEYDLIDGTGYGKYSWSNNGFLTVSYFESRNKKEELQIFSPERKLVNIIPNGCNPKWVEPEEVKSFQIFPNESKLSEKEQEQMSEANSLSDEGFTYYKAKEDDLAIEKYQEALNHYKTAEIYYHYGNSLSNTFSSLYDAINAYQLAIDLNYDKPYLAYYNIACAYSKVAENKGKINISYKEALSYLELAINNGYTNFDHIQRDDDLAFLRSQPEWKDWWVKHQK